MILKSLKEMTEVTEPKDSHMDSKTFDMGYPYAPNQIVVIALTDIFGYSTINTPVIVDNLNFDEQSALSGYPISTVLFYNRWNTGSVGGYSKMELVLHRYQSDVEFNYEMFKFFNNEFENAKDLFTVYKRDDKLYKISLFEIDEMFGKIKKEVERIDKRANDWIFWKSIDKLIEKYRNNNGSE